MAFYFQRNCKYNSVYRQITVQSTQLYVEGMEGVERWAVAVAGGYVVPPDPPTLHSFIVAGAGAGGYDFDIILR